VLGFARVSGYSDRCVYSGVGEHGVYVSRAAQDRGVGRALLLALCAAAERAGYYKLTSRIFTTNAASRAVHVAAGFDEVGIQRRHGRLDGEWRSSSGCLARPRRDECRLDHPERDRDDIRRRRVRGVSALSWDSVLAWRLERQHLAERAPRAAALDVVADIAGLHAQVASCAELTLWARVDGLEPGAVSELLWEERALVKTWAMRGTLHLLVAAELPRYVAALSRLRPRHHVPVWLRAQPGRVVRLLGGFDHYVVAAPRDAEAVLAADRRDCVYRPQGWLSPVLLVDGRMAGVWSHDVGGGRLAVTVEPFGRRTAAVKAGVEAEAERLADFLGGELSLTWA